MVYLILLILGLAIGAAFLIVLLVGDKREARLEAQQKALQEQRQAAGEAAEGAWPPPPSLPTPSALVSPKKPDLAPGTSRRMVRKFFLARNCAIGALLAAYIFYSCFPRFSFGWVLLIAALLAAVLMAVLMNRSKPRP